MSAVNSRQASMQKPRNAAKRRVERSLCTTPGDGTLSVITDTDADFGLRVSYNLCYNVRVFEAGRWLIEKFILEKCVHL